MTVRIARPADAQAIHDLHTRSVQQLCTLYTSEQRERWLHSRTPQGYLPGIDRGNVHVYEQDRQILGFSEVTAGEVLALFVAPEATLAGIGRILLEHGIELAARDGYVFLEATLNAVAFYEACGFVQTRAKLVARGTTELEVIIMERDERVTN